MAKKIFYSLMLALALLFVNGCTGGGGPELLSGNSGATPGGDISPIATSPGPSGEGIIDSSGNVIPVPPGNTAPGSAGSSQAGGNVKTSTQWLTYVDQRFGFSISYPDGYVILDEVELLRDISPNLVQRVRFLDAGLAHGDTANLEPPNFSIELFDNAPAIPLGQWIE